MTSVAMRDGAVTTFVNFGRFNSCQVSASDFGIMENSACCIVLQPGQNSSAIPILLQSIDTRRKQIEREIYGMGFVKDQGNPKALLGNLWVMVDDIYDSVNSDDTLNGSVLAAHVATISRPSVDSFIEAGTATFGFITFVVKGTEIDEPG